jgi:hypothetical protein
MTAAIRTSAGLINADVGLVAIMDAATCPRWDSNPHWTLFESAASAVGLQGRCVAASIAAADHTTTVPGPGYSESLPKATVGAEE